MTIIYDSNDNCGNSDDCDNEHDTNDYYNDIYSENIDSIDINQNKKQMERKI